MSDDFRKSALDYHRLPRPGKLEISATKPMANQFDLALAYSPGVAAACEEIEKDPIAAASYTARGNLVAVITNGTAVLGLGAIGGLASKPVMEGKAVLFKKFANVDVFDIEIDEEDPEKFIETVARLEPSFGGINLEDIKAPECFIIEKALRERMKIPVFHDDQHGTAIVVCAAVLNGLEVVGKKIEEVRLVASGAGAASLACLGLLVDLGLKRENIIVTDVKGVVYEGRPGGLDSYKAKYAQKTDLRTLEDALKGADIFLGLSAGGVLKSEWLPSMADKPLIFALANPTPEIMPDEARRVRADAILATGRSDFPNQVNNVLCFPFLFRGALDVGATEINSEMKMACVRAIAKLARAEASDVVRSAYGVEELKFGPDYLIPRPFDPRLMAFVAPAVAGAAMETSVATRPIEDLEAYRYRLETHSFPSGMVMKPVFDAARRDPRTVVYADGEARKVLEVTSQVLHQGLARPILVGRRQVIQKRAHEMGLDLVPGQDFEILDPLDNPDHEAHVAAFYKRVVRSGYSPLEAREYVRRSPTVLSSVLVAEGKADAMICGLMGRFQRHMRHVEEVIGTAPGIGKLSSMNGVVIDGTILFIADTYVQVDPDDRDIVEMTKLAVEEVRQLGIEPKVALLSHSNFGSHGSPSAVKMAKAVERLRAQMPDLELEGEMHADLAMVEEIRNQRFLGSRLNGVANLLIMPNLDAANISYNLLRCISNSAVIGPILLGAAQPVHVVTPSTSVRGLLNITALSVARASRS